MAFYPNINNFTTEQIEQAIEQSFLGKEEITPFALNNIYAEAIQKYSQDLTLELRKQITASLVNQRDGSSLAQSVKPTKIEITDKIVLQSIEGNEYWETLNYGVDGRVQHPAKTNPYTGIKFAYKTGAYPKTGGETHAEAIEKWLPKTGFSLPNIVSIKTKKPVFTSYKDWAWVIARNIKNRGIKPHGFVEKTITPESKNILVKKLNEITGANFDVIWTLEAEKQKEK